MIDRDTTLDEARKELARLVSEEVFLSIEVEAKIEKLAHLRSEIKSYRYVLGLGVLH